MNEDQTIGFYLDKVFTTDGLRCSGSAGSSYRYISDALEYQDPERSKVFLVTCYDRILEIPRTTVGKDQNGLETVLCPSRNGIQKLGQGRTKSMVPYSLTETRWY